MVEGLFGKSALHFRLRRNPSVSCADSSLCKGALKFVTDTPPLYKGGKKVYRRGGNLPPAVTEGIKNGSMRASSPTQNVIVLFVGCDAHIAPHSCRRIPPYEQNL